MKENSKILVISFYQFIGIKNPQGEVIRFDAYLKKGDFRGRIYISEEGINAQMSAPLKEAEEFFSWLNEQKYYQKTSIKTQLTDEHAFHKMIVKYRKQLCAFDVKVDFQDIGQRVSPKKWREMIEENDPNTYIIDVRNVYESEVGHFEGAILPECEIFREFPKYTEKLKEKINPKKDRVLMYCTGGIRCEYYSSFLKSKGFENIYQLDGGVIQYGHEEGSKHWKGKLFVFDDRLVVSISEESDKIISHCHYCNCETDIYYNCANMDCNELFLCCISCISQHKGCCSSRCMEGRIRPYDSSSYPKPFRKWSFEEKEKWEKKSYSE